mmetsp:Transcript_17191/g.26150  ORF Transcript_17191/g.26150 Transcript_17191/m.26150 type:complete len:220 (+) Transcript_17191:180-839(+)
MPSYSCLQNSVGSLTQQLALSSSTLDSITCTLGEGMSLNGHSLCGEVFASNNHLVNGLLRLGRGPGLEKRVKAHRTSLSGTVNVIQLDQIKDFLVVSRSSRSALELRQPTVKGLLSSLESGASGPTRTRFLSPHTKTTGGTLSGGDTASFTVFALTTTRSRAEVVEGEFLLVDGRFVGRAALPIVNFHAKLVGRAGGRVGGEIAGGEGGESRRGGDKGR